MAIAPPYRAVSYTWGDPNTTRWIKVNGRPMQVRWNCAYVLWQVYHHSGTDHYVWVDAICINQTDNREKNHQVSRLGRIFEEAERVLACIGPHDRYSKALFPVLVRRSVLFAQASTCINKYGELNQQRDVAFEKRLSRWWYGSSEPRKMAIPYLQVVTRPYFRRVWTLPELWLARNADFLCGGDYAPAQSLHGLRMIIRADMLRRDMPAWFGTVPLLRRTVSLWSRLSAVYGRPNFTDERHMGAITKKPGDRAALFSAIRATQELDCEDGRDRVYRLIPIVEWGSSTESIQPDYNMDLFDLALNVLQLAKVCLDPRHSVVSEVVLCLYLNKSTSPGTAQAIHDRRHIDVIKSTTWMANEND